MVKSKKSYVRAFEKYTTVGSKPADKTAKESEKDQLPVRRKKSEVVEKAKKSVEIKRAEPIGPTAPLEKFQKIPAIEKVPVLTSAKVSVPKKEFVPILPIDKADQRDKALRLREEIKGLELKIQTAGPELKAQASRKLSEITKEYTPEQLDIIRGGKIVKPEISQQALAAAVSRISKKTEEPPISKQSVKPASKAKGVSPEQVYQAIHEASSVADKLISEGKLAKEQKESFVKGLSNKAVEQKMDKSTVHTVQEPPKDIYVQHADKSMQKAIEFSAEKKPVDFGALTGATESITPIQTAKESKKRSKGKGVEMAAIVTRATGERTLSDKEMKEMPLLGTMTERTLSREEMEEERRKALEDATVSPAVPIIRTTSGGQEITVREESPIRMTTAGAQEPFISPITGTTLTTSETTPGMFEKTFGKSSELPEDLKRRIAESKKETDPSAMDKLSEFFGTGVDKIKREFKEGGTPGTAEHTKWLARQKAIEGAYKAGGGLVLSGIRGIGSGVRAVGEGVEKIAAYTGDQQPQIDYVRSQIDNNDILIADLEARLSEREMSEVEIRSTTVRINQLRNKNKQLDTQLNELYSRQKTASGLRGMAKGGLGFWTLEKGDVIKSQRRSRDLFGLYDYGSGYGGTEYYSTDRIGLRSGGGLGLYEGLLRGEAGASSLFTGGGLIGGAIVAEKPDYLSKPEIDVLKGDFRTLRGKYSKTYGELTSYAQAHEFFEQSVRNCKECSTLDKDRYVAEAEIISPNVVRKGEAKGGIQYEERMFDDGSVRQYKLMAKGFAGKGGVALSPIPTLKRLKKTGVPSISPVYDYTPRSAGGYSGLSGYSPSPSINFEEFMGGSSRQSGGKKDVFGMTGGSVPRGGLTGMEAVAPPKGLTGMEAVAPPKGVTAFDVKPTKGVTVFDVQPSPFGGGVSAMSGAKINQSPTDNFNSFMGLNNIAQRKVQPVQQTAPKIPEEVLKMASEIVSRKPSKTSKVDKSAKHSEKTKKSNKGAKKVVKTEKVETYVRKTNSLFDMPIVNENSAKLLNGLMGIRQPNQNDQHVKIKAGNKMNILSLPVSSNIMNFSMSVNKNNMLGMSKTSNNMFNMLNMNNNMLSMPKISKKNMINSIGDVGSNMFTFELRKKQNIVNIDTHTSKKAQKKIELIAEKLKRKLRSPESVDAYVRNKISMW